MKYKMEMFAVESCGQALRNQIPSEWENENTLIFKEDGKKIGTAILEPEAMTITGTKLLVAFKKIKTEYDKKLKDIISTKEGTESIIENFESVKLELGGLEKNKIVFNLFCKSYKDMGIENVIVGSDLTFGQTIRKELTIGFDINGPSNEYDSPPSGFTNRLKTFLFNNYSTHYEVDTSLPIRDKRIIRLFEKEKNVKINLKGTHIGNYFPERNLIQIFFSPFALFSIRILENKLHPLMLDIIESIKALKVKKVSVKSIEEKLIVTRFLKRTRDRLSNVLNTRTDYSRQIDDYQRNLADSYSKMEESFNEITFLNEMLENNGKNLFTEIDKTKKLSFVDKVDYDAEGINITYIASTIRMPNFSRTSTTKTYGRVTAYLGPLTISILPEGIRVKNPCGMKGGHTNPHPHANGGSGSPCLGGGEGADKIMSLIAKNKISDAAKALWFWIKVYKNSGAYIHYGEFYDDRLAQGYPMWDSTGTRIEINDPAKIKIGEQKTIKKADNYNDNIKKFKDLKIL